MLLAFDDKNIVLGAGQILHHQRDVAHITVTPAAAPAPTTTTFAVVTATDMPANNPKLKVGDVLQPTSVVTPAYTAVEAAALPRIVSLVVNGANTIVTVSPAFAQAPATTAGAVRVLYKNLGATDGDISIRANLTRSKQKVDQSPDVVKSRITSRELTIVAPLAEAIAPHFAIGLGISAGTDNTVLQVGATLPDDREDRFLVITPAEEGFDRYTVAHRGVHEGESALVASTENKSLINLNITLMPDTSFGAHALFDSKTVPTAA
jgi:hypothetical protein